MTSPYEIDLKIACDFIWDDLNEEEIEFLLNQNAVTLLICYARPIISNLTGSSIFPSYNLPLYNLREEND